MVLACETELFYNYMNFILEMKPTGSSLSTYGKVSLPCLIIYCLMISLSEAGVHGMGCAIAMVKGKNVEIGSRLLKSMSAASSRTYLNLTHT